MSKEEIMKNKDSLPDNVHNKKEFNHGLGRILILVTIAFLAIITLNHLKNNVKGNDVNKNAINKNAINKDAINKDAINKDAINKDAINKDVINKDTINKTTINKDTINKKININTINKDITNESTISAEKNEYSIANVEMRQSDDEAETILDNAKTTNKLGSTVNEKIDLRYYKNKSENIKGVYKIYDMSEKQNGYLVQVASSEDLLLAVIFDNIGEKVLSVKVLKGFEEIEKSGSEAINNFFDQFNRIKAPISLKDNRADRQESNALVTKEPYRYQTTSIIDAISGAEKSSEEIIRGINDAYRFLQNVIVIDSKGEEESKKL